MNMPVTIRVEFETVGDPRSTFRLRIGDKVVGANLTAMQAHLLVGEIIERIVLREAFARRDRDPPSEPQLNNNLDWKSNGARTKAAA
jgi:hypothetical protein